MRIEKTERVIIIVLVSLFLVGLATSLTMKYRPVMKLEMENFDIKSFKEDSLPASLPAENKIDINTATAEDLARIDGVGKTIAGRITEYRYRHGSFTSVDDIKNVKGVGVALFEHIKDKITVE